MLNGEFSITNYGVGNQLFQVQYTSDETLLNPTVLKLVGDKFIVVLSDIGMHKNEYWSFQKEWRYRLMFLPISTPKMMNNYDNEMGLFQARIHYGQASLPFSHYDLKIRNDCFKDMSIMLSPDITESCKIFVELLVSKYNLSANIISSELTNSIR